MGFRFQKRINLGKGFGLNVSKSGIRPSYRSKNGSINKKGFTVRSGIPGVTYRKSFSKSSKSGCLSILLNIYYHYWFYAGHFLLNMGYRKGYYRKDGTYVQGHYTSKKTKKIKKSKLGCSSILLLTTAFIGTIKIILILI